MDDAWCLLGLGRDMVGIAYCLSGHRVMSKRSEIGLDRAFIHLIERDYADILQRLSLHCGCQ